MEGSWIDRGFAFQDGGGGEREAHARARGPKGGGGPVHAELPREEQPREGPAHIALSFLRLPFLRLVYDMENRYVFILCFLCGRVPFCFILFFFLGGGSGPKHAHH